MTRISLTIRHGAGTFRSHCDPVGVDNRIDAMTQNANATTQSRSSLNDLYDKASLNWQAAIDRLGYPEAYAQLIALGLGTVELSEPLTVLDVGAGTGAFTTELLRSAAAVERVDLLDPSTKMLGAAQNRVRQHIQDVTPILGGIGSTDVVNGIYDLVLCSHVIEHVDDVPSSLAWLRSCLKPKGVLLLVVSKPHWCTALIRLRWGNAAFKPPVISGLLSETGFSLIDTVPFRKGPPSRTSCGYLAIA